MWHCPHCGAPQAETARCWVCRRSSTTCSTCRHFRTSLSADVGWCALDPKRLPLTGLEQRGCWQERHAAVVDAGATEPGGRLGGGPPTLPAELDGDSLARPVLAFVPVELLRPVVLRAEPTPEDIAPEALPQVPLAPIVAEAEVSWSERTSLFGDAEA